MADLKELFLEEMEVEQEFVSTLEVFDDYNGYNTITPHPFSSSEEMKLCDLFQSKIAEHNTITVEMMYVVLSDYSQSIPEKLKDCINEAN